MNSLLLAGGRVVDPANQFDAPADVLARLAHAHAQLIALLENEP